MSLCPHCEDWQLAETDSFCGGCGAYVGAAPQLAPVRVQASAETFQVVVRRRPDGLPPPQVRFQCRTTSTRTGGQQGSVLEGHPITVDRLVQAPQGVVCSSASLYANDRQADPVTIELVALGGRHGSRLVPVPDAGVLMMRHPEAQLQVHLGGGGCVDIEDGRPVDGLSGWYRLPVPVKNSGGAICVVGARLRVRRAEGFDEPVPRTLLSVPVVIGQGQRVLVPAVLTASEWHVLTANRGQLREGQLILETRAEGTDKPVERTFELGPFNLGRSQPASPELLLPPNDPSDPKTWIRIGRPGRIGAAIVNRGTEPFTVESVEMVHVRDAANRRSLPMDFPFADGEEVGGGASRHFELRPRLEGDDLRPGLAQLGLTVVVRSRRGRRIELRRRLTVRLTPAESILKHQICIDFGTSESAAAVLIPTRDAEGRLGEPRPVVIELGCVSVDRVNPSPAEIAARFLPTRVARREDRVHLVGPQAEAVARLIGKLARDDEAWPEGVPQAEMLREFKLNLSSDIDPAERAEAILAATAFLRHVRELIEDHPQVAARIGVPTPVVATRPRVWDHGQTSALLTAFEDAGFGQPTIIPHPGSPQTLLPESWPPLKIVLYGTGDDERSRFADLDPSPELSCDALADVAERGESPSYLLVADIGAGTGDYSLLDIRWVLPTEAVSEVAYRTDTQFVGREFRRFIGDQLAEWAKARCRALGAAALDDNDFLKQIGHAEGAAPDARALFTAVVDAIQFQPGLFSVRSDASDEARDQRLMANALLVGFFDGILPAGGADPGDLRRGTAANPETVRNLIDTLFSAGGPLRRSAIQILPLKLPLLTGMKEPLVLDLDGTWQELAGRLINQFAQRHGTHVYRIVSDLVRQGHLDSNPPPRFHRTLRTGRGGAFPLADRLLHAVFERLVPGWGYGYAPPAASKSITSWGGAWLARVLEGDGPRDILFNANDARDGDDDGDPGNAPANPRLVWRGPGGAEESLPFSLDPDADAWLLELETVRASAPGLLLRGQYMIEVGGAAPGRYQLTVKRFVPGAVPQAWSCLALRLDEVGGVSGALMEGLDDPQDVAHQFESRKTPALRREA
jgi:hypothetical protein